MDSPLAPHASSPAELQQRISAQRRGGPFLVLRDVQGAQRIIELHGMLRLSVGRRDTNDVVLDWDEEVSRLHAELEWVGGEWTLLDDGLSQNGTFVNGERVRGRCRLRDGDALRFGRTVVAYLAPGESESKVTAATGAGNGPARLTEAQRRVLVALSRPFRKSSHASPATNAEIADELSLTVDAVKAHLRGLYARFGIEELPQNQKRSQLVWQAFQSGLITTRDLVG